MKRKGLPKAVVAVLMSAIAGVRFWKNRLMRRCSDT